MAGALPLPVVRFPTLLTPFALGLAVALFTLPWPSALLAAGLVCAWSIRRRSAGIAVAFVAGVGVGWLRVAVVATDISVPFPDVLVRALGHVRDWAVSTLARALPEPEASFASGVLVGDDGLVPASFREAMRATGTLHVLAVSGYNVGIIVAAIERASASTLGRTLQTTVTLLVLAGFIVLTGAEPSVIRAGLMGSLGLVGRWLGRPADQLRLLILTAVLLGLGTPSLVYRLGFQLSVLATAGLVLFAEPLQQWLTLLPRRFGLREALATTLAAQLLTTPLLVASFGRLSLLAPLVNPLILPLVPFAMLGSALALATSWLPGVSLCGVAVAWLPITTIVRIVSWFAQFPRALLEVPSVLWLVTLLPLVLTIALRRRRAH